MQKSAIQIIIEDIEGDKNILTGHVISSGWTKFKMVNRLMVAGLNPGVMPGAVINLAKLGNNLLNEVTEGIELNGTEDIFLWQKIIRLQEEIMRVPATTYLYRRHENQISKNFNTYGASLGSVRKINYSTAATRLEKLLCISEIPYEYSTVNFNISYLEGLGNLIKYKKFSTFRIVNIFIRRTAKLINCITAK
jgi:hypothetical protein